MGLGLLDGGDREFIRLYLGRVRVRGGATLWLGGAWAPTSQRAPPKKKKKSKKKNKKYNFYPYSLKNL
jgi:hypothetical protein